MPEIHVLDSHVADLIAAGEVVERPASVAKELMENAIDAGAKTVTVEIEHGGMTFLRVSDDGCGMEAKQLKTAFLRHATSKLRTQYDLEAIGTLGFRGEALAAIAAVSRIDVMSRPVNCALGASLAIEGGVFGEVEEAGCPQGTTIVVRDLFYNTPARLKFMKKDAAEGAAVFAVVQRVALSHPEVRVKFLRDGKQELLTPGDGQLQRAIYAVLGRDLALGFLPVKSSSDELTVRGFISQPACCRGSRNYQFFFVNGRQVKSRLLMSALEEAYQNTKMVGKFPGCVLHVEVKLNSVDVNVHPAKTEVKFGNERRVFDGVYHAILAALLGDQSRPAVVMERAGKESEAQPTQAQSLPKQTVVPQSLTLNDFVRPKVNGVSTSWNRTLKSSTNPRPVVEKKTELTVEKEEEKPVLKSKEKASEFSTNACANVENSVEIVESSAPDHNIVWNRENSLPLTDETQKIETIEIEQPELPVEEIPWRIVGEVMHTYIVVEQGDTVLFIDKHAAHERMNFDRMKAQGYQPMVQTLLVPVTFRPPAEELAVLLERQPLLEEFGFTVEDFGGGALVVRQAPFDVAEGEIESTLLELAGKLLTTGRADPTAARDELLHTMACKAAIKGGWKSGQQELEQVARAVMSGAVKYCPHGRPVAIELTQKQLEKQFKRT